jgi:hypothetical protein
MDSFAHSSEPAQDLNLELLVPDADAESIKPAMLLLVRSAVVVRALVSHLEQSFLLRSGHVIEVSNIDTEGIRTPAGRAQWISSPSP